MLRLWSMLISEKDEPDSKVRHLTLADYIVILFCFLINGPIPASFCIFLLFPHYNFNNTNWEKHKWCPWDLNPGPQDGRRRRHHGAMAATSFLLVCTNKCSFGSPWFAQVDGSRSAYKSMPHKRIISDAKKNFNLNYLFWWIFAF